MPITARELETDRLILRPLRLADAPPLAALADDWLVARYTANIPHPYTIEMAEQFIAAQCYEPGLEDCVLAIVPKSTGSPIGCIGIHVGDSKERAEIGFWIGRAHWGQGIATEALAALVDFAFAECGLDVIEAGAMPLNEASHRVQAKNGFVLVGVREDDAPARGHPIQVQLRELHRRRWLSNARPALPNVLVVAVALIDADGRVLLARRPPGKSMAGLWEFPGGKVQEGESPEDALIRELKEELGIDVRKACLAPLTFASHRYEKFHLVMPIYVCRRWDGELHPREGQEIAWVRPNALKDYAMPPADAPLIPVLQDLL